LKYNLSASVVNLLAKPTSVVENSLELWKTDF